MFPFELKHRQFVQHSGGADGLVAWIAIYPQEEIVSVALCNKGNVDGLDWVLAYPVETLYDLL